MMICIIGGGIAGIVAARHCIANGFNFDILEARNDLGGTWLYSEQVGDDEYGYKIYSNLYPGLRTNLPKEVMSFPDYPHKPNRSFLTAEEVLKYIRQYSDHFGVTPHIKFNRLVYAINPEESKWVVKSVDKPSRERIADLYDAVLVCTGVYNDPIVPTLPGIENFKGRQMHSNVYRTPDMFKDQNVLVIGAGPSGKDVARYSYKIAKHVVLCHHNPFFCSTESTENVTIKPDVKTVLENGEVEFEDGTTFAADYIVYCTGYKKGYHFLKPECGLTVEDFLVKPLYKHMINIENPTMCIIGLPIEITAFRMIDLQSRFYMEYLKGTMKLPSKEEMLKDTEDIMQERIKNEGRSFPKSTHSFFLYQEKYFQELATAANIKNIPPVIFKMWHKVVEGICGNILYNYRDYDYTVIDDENFTMVNGNYSEKESNNLIKL